MAEEKILIPAYKRSGTCTGCGADLYSPDIKQSGGGGWPSMSACACEQGPQVARTLRAKDSAVHNTQPKPEEHAQAA